VVVDSGVTRLSGAVVGGDVVVRGGGSVVVDGGQITGGLDASGAKDVQAFGAKVLGATRVTGSTGNTTLANNLFNGGVTRRGRRSRPRAAANKRAGARRDRMLEAAGYPVVRFTDDEIERRPADVLARLLRCL
jgi:hypothetical protein